MINKLPNWILNSNQPSFYESESATAIEMSARLHGKMNEVIDEVNRTEEDNTRFKEETTQANEEWRETAESAMRQEFQDFIDVVDLKMNTIANEATRHAKSIMDKYIDERKEELQNGEWLIQESVEQAKAYLEGVGEQVVTDMNLRLETVEHDTKNQINMMLVEAEAEINKMVENLDKSKKKVLYEGAVNSMGTSTISILSDWKDYDYYIVEYGCMGNGGAGVQLGSGVMTRRGEVLNGFLSGSAVYNGSTIISLLPCSLTATGNEMKFSGTFLRTSTSGAGVSLSFITEVASITKITGYKEI